MSSSAIKITIYTKQDCPLCDEMTAVLKCIEGHESWQIEYVDIESDPEIYEANKDQIPVLFINDRKAFKGRVTKAQLEKKIMKAKALSSSPEPLDFQDEVYVPPNSFLLLFALSITIGFSYFIFQGFSGAQTGIRDFSAQLLRVEDRQTPAIDFDLEKIEGGRLSLSDLNGKIVFLNFWATWCPPCIEEMPSIRKLHEKIKDRSDIVMLLISADESWAPVKKFFGEDAPPFTVLLDPEGQIAKKYGTTRFPETFIVIDKKINAFVEGPRDWDAWYAEAYLESF
jgi:peroxiredoxin/glutaredoxin